MRNIKITVEYEGTRYSGWQRQKNAETVQEKIEDAVFKITGEKNALNGSGRTDAGVHALAQTANFHTECRMKTETILKALNSFLPEDISVKTAEEVSAGFHSRISSKKKTYLYRILNGASRSALNRKTCWFITEPLDTESMSDATRFIVGKHNFAAFALADTKVRTTVRTVFEAGVKRDGDFIVFSIEADGFLKRMVRLIVGTLVRVGKGKLNTAGFEKILKSGKKTADVTAAPARGLFLEKVDY